MGYSRGDGRMHCAQSAPYEAHTATFRQHSPAFGLDRTEHLGFGDFRCAENCISRWNGSDDLRA